MKGSTKDIIQWHPAFHASIQIEFKDEAEKRIEALSSAANDIFKYHKGESISVEKFKQYLQEEYVSVDEQYEYAVKDFEKAIALFKEEQTFNLF